MSSITFAERYNDAFQRPAMAEAADTEPQFVDRPAEDSGFDIEGTIAVLNRLAARAEAVSQAAENLYTALRAPSR